MRQHCATWHVLLGYLVERAIVENCATYEFLRGDEKYKYKWTTDTKHMMKTYLYNRSAFGGAMKVGAEAIATVRNLVRTAVKGYQAR